MKTTITDLALLAAAFAGATALAALLGAANFGTALTFGELAFAGTLMWVLCGTDRYGGSSARSRRRAWHPQQPNASRTQPPGTGRAEQPTRARRAAARRSAGRPAS